MMRNKIPVFLKNKAFVICCLLVFLVALLFRFYRFSDKEGFFIDEYFSVILANYSEHGWGKYIEDDTTVFKGEDLTEWFLSKDNSLSQIIEDVDNLHKTTRDTPHTNLYYSLLRLSFWNADTSDLGQIMGRAFILNLFLFSLGFLFLLFMSLKLFDSKILVVCILAVAFINPGSIANTMFVRPYQLQETLLILYTYMFVVYYVMLSEKERVFATWKNMLIIASISALGILSGYFSIIYIFALCVILLGRIILKATKAEVGFFICTMLLSFVFVFFLYNGYLSGIFDYRGEEAMDKFRMDVFVDNWRDSIAGMSYAFRIYLGKSILIYVFLVLFLFALIRKMVWGKYSRIALVISLCAFVWIVVVMYAAPYKNARYMIPLLPMFLLFVPSIFSFYNRKVQFVLVLLAIGWITYKAIDQKNVYIEYGVIDEAYTNDKNVPLIVVALDDWKQVSLMAYYTKGRTVEYAFDEETFKRKIDKYSESYVVIGADSVMNYALPDTARYNIVEKESPYGFVWYKTLKKDSVR